MPHADCHVDAMLHVKALPKLSAAAWQPSYPQGSSACLQQAAADTLCMWGEQSTEHISTVLDMVSAVYCQGASARHLRWVTISTGHDQRCLLRECECQAPLAGISTRHNEGCLVEETDDKHLRWVTTMSRTRWGFVFLPEMRKAEVWNTLYTPCTVSGAPLSCENSSACFGCRNARQWPRNASSCKDTLSCREGACLGYPQA